jgi:hypothetical protein
MFAEGILNLSEPFTAKEYAAILPRWVEYASEQGRAIVTVDVSAMPDGLGSFLEGYPMDSLAGVLVVLVGDERVHALAEIMRRRRSAMRFAHAYTMDAALQLIASC